jgi:hypothetical protein
MIDEDNFKRFPRIRDDNEQKSFLAAWWVGQFYISHLLVAFYPVAEGQKTGDVGLAMVKRTRE